MNTTIVIHENKVFFCVFRIKESNIEMKPTDACGGNGNCGTIPVKNRDRINE